MELEEGDNSFAVVAVAGVAMLVVGEIDSIHWRGAFTDASWRAVTW